ncbi:hypothetical protein ESCO_000539 [Escovopsis weberi]|uniref:Uncharacterized protein n=1 Tax=Escovopsis weberi TaxID=150374 RepID=A0A0M8N279_ESCWE|nr:hypothetical protein ESCO_000539 [Escovopsis weberi]
MYHQWSNHQFEMNSQASQSSSPMNNAPPGPPDFPYDERRTPVPPEAPYLGSKASKTPIKGRGPRSNSQLDPADDHKNCYGQEIPPTLKSTCPEEERCIFESRWRHRHKRGQDMWDSIQADFYKKFGKQHGKEMLQMKFKRGRAKYLQWPDRDDQLVREAFRKLEKNRYQLILNYFLEMGGSRNMLLSASDIEIKVVNDLKLEDNIYVEAGDGLDVRRRRKVPMKKRPGAGSGSRAGDGSGADVHDMLNVMSHSSLTEDDVINQVYERRDRWDEGPSSPPLGGVNGNGVNGGTGGGEMLDVQLWESRAPMKSEPTHLMKYGAHMVGAHHQGPPSQLYQRRK